MKHKYSDERKIEVVGVLDRNESDNLVINIEEKDNLYTIDFEELLDLAMGSVITFKYETNYG